MDSDGSLVSRIDATWFGAGLDGASQARLATFAREYEAVAGTKLLREGEEARELSVLLHGRVSLSEHVPGRGPITILTVEPGDIFGWSAVMPPFRATSTVTALDAVHVVAFDGARLRAAARADNALAADLYQQILEAVARRLLATRRQLLELSGATVREHW